MISIFFNKTGDQKKWVILVFSILIPLLFSAWGILLSIKSLKLSQDTAQNREQIESMNKMIVELKNQNGYLQRSVEAQESQLTLYTDDVKYSRRPFLKVSDYGTSGGDEKIVNLDIYLDNAGGDLLNLTCESIGTSKIVASSLPKKRTVIAGTRFDVSLLGVSDGSGVRFYFSDGLNNKYYQDLLWNQTKYCKAQNCKLSRIERNS